MIRKYMRLIYSKGYSRNLMFEDGDIDMFLKMNLKKISKQHFIPQSNE